MSISINNNKNKKLVYCATPARLSSKRVEIMNYVTEHGGGPFHPFQAFEYERFEGGPIGREKTIEFCCRAIEICDEFWLFGISEGTLIELAYIINFNKNNKNNQKEIRYLYKTFDPEWKGYYEKHRDRFTGLLNGLN
jgi:hypothetical protein